MYFYFNNNSSESFKVILSDFPELPFVQEEIKTVEVGGRDGTLTKRTGKYKDLLISLECELLDIGERYIAKTIHPTSKRACWIFLYTDTLKKYLDNRPKQNRKVKPNVKNPKFS